MKSQTKLNRVTGPNMGYIGNIKRQKKTKNTKSVLRGEGSTELVEGTYYLHMFLTNMKDVFSVFHFFFDS